MSAIILENLGFAYGDRQALHGISCQIKEGEIFGFLGPSGAGKSTTQKVLYRLLQGYTGYAEVLGKPITSWDRSYYASIGVGFELPNHYGKLTALENLQFFAAFYPKALPAMELLEMVGLSEDAHKKVSEFSKGMKMRLNFARAIQHEPKVLFLDEPTSGLDPNNAKLMRDAIAKLRSQGKTIFLTTHSMHDADELCDRVGFLVAGRLLAVESPKALKLQHGQRKVKIELADGSAHEFPLDGLAQNAEFLSTIGSQRVETMHSEEATLEDVFIKVTGQTLT